MPLLRSLRLTAVLLIVLSPLSCGKFGGGVHLYLDEPFPEKLSAWGLFKSGSSPLTPSEGVIPYDLNTPLFSDYASKYRFVWMPSGTAAVYREKEVFDFPQGTIISKSFAFPDERRPGQERLIETRLLVRGKERWIALPYVWNEQQTEARLELAASPVEISFKDPAGRPHQISYSIPNVNECAQCHEREKALQPIGPKARNINRDFTYHDGPANQIDHWMKIGYLKSAPASSQAPRAPVWNDPNTGSLEARARAYLDNNCAHCHQPGGVAGYTAFLTRYDESDSRKQGFFKFPNSAGFTGNRPFDIVPGHPEQSILIYRMESTKPKERMPEVSRELVHTEGVELLREWLASLPESR